MARLHSHKAERTFSDIDFLVAPSHFQLAHRVLTNYGYRQSSESFPQRGYFATKCREAVNLRDNEGGSIDLHHHISPWLWSRSLTLATIESHGSRQLVHGRNVLLASPEHNFLIAALHLVSDHGRPGATYRIWRDVLSALAHCSNETLIQEARKANLLFWLRWILQCLPEVLRPAGLLQQLDTESDDASHILRMRALLSHRLSDDPHLAQIFRLPSPCAFLYLIGVLVPSKQFLHHHFGNPTHPYMRWWSECLRHPVELPFTE
jgi:hypothetical protein